MRSHTKNISLKLSTFVVLTACFSTIVTTILFSGNFKNLLTMWGEDIQMTVYLAPGTTNIRRESIESFLTNTGKVGAITYITQEKALSDFRVQLSSYAPDLVKDDELLKLIPESLQVKISAEVPAQDQMKVLQDLSTQLKSLEGIDDVSFGQDWIEKYGAVVSAIQHSMQALGVIILAACILVMSNAIRASVQLRKEEIAVLEMIGATYSYIRRPFLIEGAILGGTSAAVAVVLSFLAYTGTRSILVEKLSFIQLGRYLSFMSPMTTAFFVIGGVILGALGSYLCVRSINDGWASSSKVGANS